MNIIFMYCEHGLIKIFKRLLSPFCHRKSSISTIFNRSNPSNFYFMSFCNRHLAQWHSFITLLSSSFFFQMSVSENLYLTAMPAKVIGWSQKRGCHPASLTCWLNAYTSPSPLQDREGRRTQACGTGIGGDTAQEHELTQKIVPLAEWHIPDNDSQIQWLLPLACPLVSGLSSTVCGYYSAHLRCHQRQRGSESQSHSCMCTGYEEGSRKLRCFERNHLPFIQFLKLTISGNWVD